MSKPAHKPRIAQTPVQLHGRIGVRTSGGTKKNNPSRTGTGGNPAPSSMQAYTRTYSYDKMGNILQLKQTAGNAFTRNFKYNSLSNNNLLHSIKKADNTTNYATFTYDSNGNKLTAGSTRFYVWNYADQLKAYLNQTGTSEPSVYAQYLYSGGQRVKKLVRTSGGGTETTVYIDGVFEHKYDGTNSQSIVRVGGVATVRTGYAFDGLSGTSYELSNHLGSVSIRLDDTGGVIDREEYYPFGDSSVRTWDKKRYRYVGKEKDAESGLYYYGARYYSAWTCRFMSMDPLARDYPQLTPYNYASNKPVNSLDVDGMQNPDEPKVPESQQPHQYELPNNSNKPKIITESDVHEGVEMNIEIDTENPVYNNLKSEVPKPSKKEAEREMNEISRIFPEPRFGNYMFIENMEKAIIAYHAHILETSFNKPSYMTNITPSQSRELVKEIMGYENIYEEFAAIPKEFLYKSAKNVIPDDNFIGYSSSDGKGCLRRCEDMVKSIGYESGKRTTEYHDQLLNQNGSFVSDIVSTNYIVKIQKALNNGIPVIAGVDHSPGDTGNYDKITDHYIVIVGYGFEGNKLYFNYYDPETSDKAVGTKITNKLYVGSGSKLIGTYTNKSGGTKNYTVTQIRFSHK